LRKIHFIIWSKTNIDNKNFIGSNNFDYKGFITFGQQNKNNGEDIKKSIFEFQKNQPTIKSINFVSDFSKIWVGDWTSPLLGFDRNFENLPQANDYTDYGTLNTYSKTALDFSML